MSIVASARRIKGRARMVQFWFAMLELQEATEQAVRDCRRSQAITAAECSHYLWLLEQVWNILVNERPRTFTRETRAQMAHTRAFLASLAAIRERQSTRSDT